MPEETTAGRIITFHGGKAGEGKSFLAHNLAAALADHGRRSVLFVDLNAEAAEEAQVRWEMAPGQTIADLAPRLSRFDARTLRGFFPQTRSGVDLALLGAGPQQALEVTSAQLLRALALFRTAYAEVIVDGLAGWDALALAVLDASDAVLLVSPPDASGLRQARRDGLRYGELKFPASKIRLVVNRCDLPEALGAAAFEQALPGYRVCAAIPFDPRAVEAGHAHRDLAGLYPRAPFARAIRALAATLRDAAAGTAAAGLAAADGPGAGSESPSAAPSAAPVDRVRIKERIHALLLENPELKTLASDPLRSEAGQALLREKVESVVTGLMSLEVPELTAREDREQMVREVVDEALGLGPLEDLIRDEAVTEIMVNRRDQIYVERRGRLTLSGKHFLSDKQLMTVIERIVAPLGRRIDESQPYVDARLADGSRVNAIIPPLALKGPCLTIRKFSRQRLVVADLIRFGSLTQAMADFLGACVAGRKNIVISGGTGSGKTTLLNIVAAFIPEEERIVTVEDAAELNLPQPHVVTLESRPANIEGKGAITIRDLVRNCLRMRPDRIVVGECRGGEALDMLQAMNTGHDGSLTTAHANSPRDVIARLETMVLMSGMDLPVRAIREQVAGAVDVVVQQSRLQDGSRKVTAVSEVTGLEDGVIALKDVFVFHQTGVDAAGKVTGDFKATGYVPPFVAELSARGIALDPKIFKK